RQADGCAVRVRLSLRVLRIPSDAPDRAAMGRRAQRSVAAAGLAAGTQHRPVGVSARLEREHLPLPAVRSNLDRWPRQLAARTSEPSLATVPRHHLLPGTG